MSTNPVKQNPKSLEINRGAHLVVPRIKVRGVKQRTHNRGENVNGDTLTAIKEVERDYSTSEYKPACTPADRLRGIVRRSTLATPLGLMTDAENAEKLKSALMAASQDVRDWNSNARVHTVRCEVMVVPVGASLDGIGDTVGDIVKTALCAVNDALATGRANEVRAALQRYENTGCLLVGLLRDAWGDVVNATRKAMNTMKKRAAAGETEDSIARTPSPEVGEALSVTQGCESMLMAVAPAATPIED